MSFDFLDPKAYQNKGFDVIICIKFGDLKSFFDLASSMVCSIGITFDQINSLPVYSSQLSGHYALPIRPRLMALYKCALI